MEVVSYLVAGVVGYGFSVGLGHLIIPRCINRLYERSNIVRDPLLPAWTGTLERILYTTVVLMGFGAFIPVWLLVKVGRGWRVPARVQKEGKERALQEREEIPTVEGARYNIFLIGNALSVMFGVFGALIIQHLPRLIMLIN